MKYLINHYFLLGFFPRPRPTTTLLIPTPPSPYFSQLRPGPLKPFYGRLHNVTPFVTIVMLTRMKLLKSYILTLIVTCIIEKTDTQNVLFAARWCEKCAMVLFCTVRWHHRHYSKHFYRRQIWLNCALNLGFSTIPFVCVEREREIGKVLNYMCKCGCFLYKCVGLCARQVFKCNIQARGINPHFPRNYEY